MEVDNPFNFGMYKTKAAYLPHDLAFPMRYVLDPALAGSGEAQKVKEACPYNAIDLDMQPKTFSMNVGAVVWATGWSPYDASRVEYYRFNQSSNVVSNMMMERLAP
jgi:quinone-modifying oxidoreductase subunit QmoA